MRSDKHADGPFEIGSRLELFVDDTLIARMAGGARLRLHRPVPQDIVLATDKPWEGNACGYFAIFQDGALYRMYYRGWHYTLTDAGLQTPRPPVVCYAESTDGVHWVKPELGLVEFEGSKKNNIILGAREEGDPGEGFAPFRDPNPAVAPGEQYKAWCVGSKPLGLYPYKSPDGIRWTRMSDTPVITYGAFDSHNVVFYDAVRGEYRDYHRGGFENGAYAARKDGSAGGVRGSRWGRDILTSTSKDFLHWGAPVYVDYRRGRAGQLYTNGVVPYFRAPHIFIGLPTRYVERPWTDAMDDLPELEHRQRRSKVNLRYGTALTETLLMSSRDGQAFDLWPEAFIRPGLRPTGNWAYGDNYASWGIVTTRSPIAGAPDELAIYATEGYWRGEHIELRRYTLRTDGFVSVEAPLSGGEIVTRPLIFDGRELVLNFSASAAGSVRVEILRDEVDLPVEGFALENSREILGDDLERTVHWAGKSDVGPLRGIPIRLRFVLKDADLFAFRFRH